MDALLVCTDNVTLAGEQDRSYRGLDNPLVKAAFEGGLEAVVEVLGQTEKYDPPR